MAVVALCFSVVGCGDESAGGTSSSVDITVSASVTQGVSPLQVEFITTLPHDGSGKTIEFSWDFGDGSPDSSEQNPTHTYTEVGSFSATLTVDDHERAPITKSIAIDVFGALAIELDADRVDGVAPMEIDFTATVTGGQPPLSYEWDFGDGEGTTSELPAVSHQFASVGEFDVSVTVTDALGNSEQVQQAITIFELPQEYADVYPELAAGLDEFEALVDSQWDGSKSDTRFAAQLAVANGNGGAGLTTPEARTYVVEMLDAFVTLGVDVVKIEGMYPILTPAYHEFLSTFPKYGELDVDVQDYIDFYQFVVAEINQRGFEVIIGHSNTFPSYSRLPVGEYYKYVKNQAGCGEYANCAGCDVEAVRVRFRQERWAEISAFVTLFEPKSFIIVEEPNTNNYNFGPICAKPEPVPLYDDDGWIDFVEYMLAQVKTTGIGAGTSFGAGTGSWEEDDFIRRYVLIDDLDFIDIHVYALRSSTAHHYEKLFDWIDYIRTEAPSKGIVFAETGLVKLNKAEVDAGAHTPVEIFARNVWEFWQPLDRQFLEVFYKFCHLKGVDIFMPFWTQHFFKYIEYDYELSTKTEPQELLRMSMDVALPYVRDYELSGTGETYVDIMSRDDLD